MRKFLSLLIIFCLALTAAGCGEKRSSPSQPIPSTEIPSPTETTLNQEETQAPTETQPALPDKPLPDFLTTPQIEPTVLYQENNVKITAEALSYDNYSVNVELLIENNSAKPLTFICESLGYSCNSVNDYMIENGYLNCTVDPGKKANDTVSFRIQELILHGIYQVKELEIGFDISDEEYNHITTGPIQLKTSAFDSPDLSDASYLETLTNAGYQNSMKLQVPYTSQELLYDENGIRLLSACLIQNKNGEQTLMVEAENGTEEMLDLAPFDISLNGLKVQSSRHSSLTMNPGKRGFLTIAVDSALKPQFRESYGLDQISSIGFRVAITDPDLSFQEESHEITVDMGLDGPGFDTTGPALYSQDGLQIIAKGMLQDSSEYSKNQHILLLAVNDTDQEVKISDVYDSVSVNGFMSDYYFYDQNLPAGKSCVLRIELTDSSLEKNKIEKISEAEIRLNINGEEITLNMGF